MIYKKAGPIFRGYLKGFIGLAGQVRVESYSRIEA